MMPAEVELAGADGVSLHALVWSHEGTLLLLVHGFGNDAHVWDEIAPALAPHYRTVALSLRGHGDSGRGPQPSLDAELLVRDLEAAVQALSGPRLVLVGHSLGGRVAMRFAARNPAAMAGLVLVDSGPEHDTRGTGRIREETRSQVGDRTRGFASPAEYLRVLERQYPAARPDTLARLAQHWLRRREDGRYELKLDLRRPGAPASPVTAPLAAPVDLWESLRKTTCKTLVVRGAASDVLSQETAERMVEEALPDARLCVIARASHSVMLDNPDAFREALCGFVLG